MAKVIAVSNQKGGVAKTTTVVNLGIGLAKLGKKVLLIDADAQGSMSISLGIPEPDRLDYTLANVIADTINETAVSEKAILCHDEGVDFIPSNIDLSSLEVQLVSIMGRKTVLKQYIDKIRANYDYIIIDCMPSLGIITINALACADSVLIPVQAAYLPIRGLQELIKTIGKVRKQINPLLEIEGIIITIVDVRTNYSKDIIKMINETYGQSVKVFDNFIPHSVKQEETPVSGGSIYKYSKKSKVAKAYESLAETISETKHIKQ